MVFHSNCTISFTKRPQKRHRREIPVYPVFVLEGSGITNEYVQNNPTTEGGQKEMLGRFSPAAFRVLMRTDMTNREFMIQAPVII